ncbi:MAG: PAS domain S-box protein [Puniceicoccales bacterium]
MSDEIEKWKRRYERERNSRKEAERLLEEKAYTLFEKNQELAKLSDQLARTVERRTEELRYSESKLREEEARLTSLAQTFPGVIFQWYQRENGEFGLYYMSARVEEIFGFSAEAAIADPKVIPFHPADIADWRKSIDDSLKTMSDWRFTGRMIMPSGDVKWWQGDSKPLRVSPNEVVFNGVMLDITHQKKAEEEIRRLSLVASKTINGVVITDPGGRTVWVNEAFEKITGYALSELKGRKPGDVLQGPMTNNETVAMIGEKLKQGEPLTAELLNYHKNGDTYWLRLDINPLFDSNGNLASFVGIETDITKQKETETALKLASQHAREAAEEANRANQAKSRFLASMSHEIRTPLNGVLGYTQVLNMRDDLPEDAAKMISSIGRSGEHLLQLINDILDLSKIEAGKFQLNDEDVSLQDILRDLQDMFQPNAELKGIAYSVQAWDFDQDHALETPFFFQADERAVRQVLVNLVGNAVKFTKTGSVALKGGPDDGALRFTVTDSGPGIAAEDQHRIFESFEQSSAKEKTVEGTGLGLPICRKLVELMEGSMYLDSVVGEGSVFWFNIPYLAPKEDHSHYVPRLTQSQGKFSEQKYVLVVDDDENSRRVTAELLAVAGMRVASASGGREGLELMARELPDLVASDLLMPEMDGFEFCQHIKGDPTLMHVPVVAVSASVMQDKENAARLKPFSEFVAKPVKAGDLYQKVGQVLGITWEATELKPKEEQTKPSTPVAVKLPDESTLKRLLLLAEEGDILSLQETVESMAEADPDCGEFYGRLRDLAAQFQSQALEDLLNDSINNLTQ